MMPIQIGDRPDAGFDEPLRLLTDCHRRIERFLGILERVAQTHQGGVLDEESRRALQTALRYFRDAAPKHAADEEDSLFPRLREATAGQDLALLAVMERLESDHQTVRAGHDAIERLGNRWLADNRLLPAQLREMLDHVAALKQAYAAHIEIEDTQVFPAAGRVLGSDALADVGREMAARRGLTLAEQCPSGD